MRIIEYKLRTNQVQRAAIDEAIRTVQFVRNKCLRLWMDGRGIGDMTCKSTAPSLKSEYPFAARLNSQARQTSADRAWLSIARFYKNCERRNQAKRATPVSSITTVPLNTRRRGGNWKPMESA